MFEMSHTEDPTHILGDPTDALDEAAGELLAGRYQLLNALGTGGMGQVVRGYDLDLEEIVAIKLLHKHLADSLRATFRREVRLARRVTHPNVARVYEFGRDGRRCFLTMEFIDGPSLQAFLREAAPLSPKRLLPIAQNLCRGLAAAHRANVVHGDIKPGNVLLDPRRGAVLTDFGIARCSADELAPDQRTSGTPLYMAPEQARGERLGPESDVYSVAMLLFTALTGRSPWPTLNPLDIRRRKRAGENPELGALDRVPPPWANFLRTCLTGDRHRRPVDARELLERLDELLSPGATPSSATSTAVSLPLAAGDAVVWVEVEDLGGAADNPLRVWARNELRAALGRQRQLRVITRSDGPAFGPRPQHLIRISGRVDTDDDALALTLALRGGAASIDVELNHRQPRAVLQALGVELAAKIASALERPVEAPKTPEPLAQELVELYVAARQAYGSFRYREAHELFARGLEQAPHSMLFQLGSTSARVQVLYRFGHNLDSEQFDTLEQAVNDTIARYGEFGDAHMARARLDIALGDSVGCARALRAALARSPSLIEAHALLGDLLIDIGRLPDATRRLDIALALDPGRGTAWVSKARLLAYEGRWAEMRALIDGPLTELRCRPPLIARLLFWADDRAGLEALELVYRFNLDDLSPALLPSARLLIDFFLERGDRRALLDSLIRETTQTVHARLDSLAAQILVELACSIGAVDQATEALRRADRAQLIDRQWIEACPIIEPVRQSAIFPEVRDHVRARADAIAEAIWG